MFIIKSVSRARGLLRGPLLRNLFLFSRNSHPSLHLPRLRCCYSYYDTFGFHHKRPRPPYKAILEKTPVLTGTSKRGRTATATAKNNTAGGGGTRGGPGSAQSSPASATTAANTNAVRNGKGRAKATPAATSTAAATAAPPAPPFSPAGSERSVLAVLDDQVCTWGEGSGGREGGGGILEEHMLVLGGKMFFVLLYAKSKVNHQKYCRIAALVSLHVASSFFFFFVHMAIVSLFLCVCVQKKAMFACLGPKNLFLCSR